MRLWKITYADTSFEVVSSDDILNAVTTARIARHLAACQNGTDAMTDVFGAVLISAEEAARLHSEDMAAMAET
jgi:hypothetical protein